MTPPTRPGCRGAYDQRVTESRRERDPGAAAQRRAVRAAARRSPSTSWPRRGGAGSTATAIAARARAGKAGIYRRWPTMAALARAAVSRFTPRHHARRTAARCAPTCVALVDRWTPPAGPRGAGRGQHRRRRPPRGGAARRAGRGAGAAARRGGRRDRRARRGPRASRSTPSRLALLGSVLEAFWWQRFTAAGDGAMTAEQVERVVDDVLLPIVAPASTRASRSPPPV